MYLPEHFDAHDPDLLLEVMRKHSFATLISVIDGEPFATHVPVMARHVDGALDISGHLARANPHWRALESAKALVIFHGPHAYISPSLYTSSSRVPTWNYIAVHATGDAALVDGAEAKLAMLENLISQHEPGYRAQFAALDPKLYASLSQAIVGFTIRVTGLQGKFKLGQHRLADDRPEMQARHEAGDDDQRELAFWMKRLGYWT